MKINYIKEKCYTIVLIIMKLLPFKPTTFANRKVCIKTQIATIIGLD